jgi:flagellar biosynthesis protein FlhG
MKSQQSCPQVIGIASGKGGVGKTTVSVNLAVALALRGRKVMLLDADLGMANAQISLGVKTPWNIGHVLRGEKTLHEVAVTTPQGVSLVPGVSGLREAAALDMAQIGAIVHAFDDLEEPIDYLIVDVAAGISPPVLAFMAACQRRFVVLCDQPSSIADAYGMIKVMTLEEDLDEVYLIPNMVDSPLEGKQLFGRMNDVCTRFLGQSVRHLGSIESDELVLAAQRKYKTVLDFAPGSKGAADFRRLAQAVEDLPPIEQPSGRLQFFMQRMLQTSTLSR